MTFFIQKKSTNILTTQHKPPEELRKLKGYITI